ncbi:helix-turn-helix domain-containing protein (plasmid) [Bacillus thuringiensis]|uniref:helix-turn-helix domain-containing protein n=1 Tax=Bacillus thuringiensis TaxID=1428 RepID=UPI003D74AB2A
MFAGVRNGLMAYLGSELWQTYCALATYMDRDGYCYPSQSQLGKAMGVRRETAGERIRRLCEVEWQGEKLVVATKAKHGGNKFANTRYWVNPKVGFRFSVESGTNTAP